MYQAPEHIEVLDKFGLHWRLKLNRAGKTRGECCSEALECDRAAFCGFLGEWGSKSGQCFGMLVLVFA